MQELILKMFATESQSLLMMTHQKQFTFIWGTSHITDTFLLLVKGYKDVLRLFPSDMTHEMTSHEI